MRPCSVVKQSTYGGLRCSNRGKAPSPRAGAWALGLSAALWRLLTVVVASKRTDREKSDLSNGRSPSSSCSSRPDRPAAADQHPRSLTSSSSSSPRPSPSPSRRRPVFFLLCWCRPSSSCFPAAIRRPLATISSSSSSCPPSSASRPSDSTAWFCSIHTWLLWPRAQGRPTAASSATSRRFADALPPGRWPVARGEDDRREPETKVCTSMKAILPFYASDLFGYACT